MTFLQQCTKKWTHQTGNDKLKNNNGLIESKLSDGDLYWTYDLYDLIYEVNTKEGKMAGPNTNGFLFIKKKQTTFYN